MVNEAPDSPPTTISDTSDVPDGARDDGDGPTTPVIDVDAYLDRIGVDPETVETSDHETLARLQRAHVTSVPFENLAIVGDPHDPPTGTDHHGREATPVAPGPGVDLSIPALYEKIVERRRGGYCFELNGLFATLLDRLGYAADRVAARVASGLTVPANHHSIIVTLDERYVVDVGTGAPMIRNPLPLDGTPVEDAIGVRWRVTTCDRPDEDYQTEYLEPGADEWETRYVFSTIPRTLSYFHATNDYLQHAPESTFTSDPIVQLATADGHLKLTRDTLAGPHDDTERFVNPSDWHDILAREFGVAHDH